MNLINLFNHDHGHTISKSWDIADRIALGRILYEIYWIDGEFSGAEKQALKEKIKLLDIEQEQIDEICVDEALKRVTKDSLKMDLVYIWIADALFADDILKNSEIEFVNAIIEKYRLSEKKLQKRIHEIAMKKIEKVFNQWLKQALVRKYYQ